LFCFVGEFFFQISFLDLSISSQKWERCTKEKQKFKNSFFFSKCFVDFLSLFGFFFFHLRQKSREIGGKMCRDYLIVVPEIKDYISWEGRAEGGGKRT
jgi:hypothetical protein